MYLVFLHISKPYTPESTLIAGGGLYALLSIAAISVLFFFPDYTTWILFIWMAFLGVRMIHDTMTPDISASDVSNIRQSIVGRLKINESPFQIINSEGVVLVPTDFSGTVTLECNSFLGEVSGSGRNRHVHYGTDNRITISKQGRKKRYYIFVENELGKKRFIDLARVLLAAGIDTKEYVQGQRVYFGKSLNYKEIQAFKAKYLVRRST